jgi:ribosome-binding factor A
VKRARKGGSDRPQKLGEVIQRELSELLARELRDPRVGMITITSVDVSPDLSHAKVFFTILEKQKLEETSEGLQRSAGFLRSQLAKRMKLYTTPQLRFVYDESVERGDRLSRLIDSAIRKK